MTKINTSLVAGLALLIGSTSADAFVSEDFESFTNGSTPTASVLLNGGGSNANLEVEVVDLGSSGIIGGPGNQGVVLEDLDASDTSLLGYRGAGVTQGTASWKFAARRGGGITSTITYFRLGASSTGNPLTFPEMAIELYMSANGRFFMSTDPGSTNTLVKLNPSNDPDANKPYLTDRQEHDFQVDFDTTAETFSVSIDGVQLVLDSDNTTSTFAFKNSIASIDAIDFTTGSNAVAASLFYLDDIVVESSGLLEGDLDGNGFVGVDDLNIVLVNWNQNVTPGDLASGDVTGEGFVGVDDLNVVLVNWNNGTPPNSQASIPEPSTLALLGAGALAIFQRKSPIRI